MKFDAQGRQVIAVEVLADWSELTGIPERVLEIAALVDPGANTLLAWDDTLNDIVASNALPMTITASWVFSGELFTRTHDEARNILIDADSVANEGRWEWGVEPGMLRSGARTDADDGGEDWYQVTRDDTGQILEINLQGDAASFNGDEIVTEAMAGSYTPTLTNAANLDASTAFECQFMRIGNVVTVSGKVAVDPTAGAVLTRLGISLPIASAFTAEEHCAGTAFASGIAGQGAAIRADATNDRAEMAWISVDLTNQPMYFSFTYRIL